MHGRAKTAFEQLITSIVDSRSGNNDVAFRTAPPIGGISCVSARPFDVDSATVYSTVEVTAFS